MLDSIQNNRELLEKSPTSASLKFGLSTEADKLRRMP